MSAARDVQRSRVYTAELAAFGDTLADEAVDLPGLRTLAGILFSDPWWRLASGGVVPRVVAAHADARRSTATSGVDGDHLIRIAPDHDQPPTLSHEAAHVLCNTTPSWRERGLAAHGSEFRAAHLAVAAALLGGHGRRLLATAYRSSGLDWTDPPPWPAPPEESVDDHGILGRWREAIAL